MEIKSNDVPSLNAYHNHHGRDGTSDVVSSALGDDGGDQQKQKTWQLPFQQSAGEELVGAVPAQYGSGTCKWFNTCLGFSFLTVTSVGGTALDSPREVFVHRSKIHVKGYRSLKDGEPVQFAFVESPKGFECIWVTGPEGAYCSGKRKPQRQDKCYNCSERGHCAKECKLPPQPKRCHFCQSLGHLVTSCPNKAQQ